MTSLIFTILIYLVLCTYRKIYFGFIINELKTINKPCMQQFKATNYIKMCVFKPGARPQPAEGRLWACAWFTEIVFVKVCVCTYLPIYLCLSVRTHVSKIVNNGKSSFYVRSKSEMKSVLNFCTGELCSEVVSFRRTEIRVW